MDKLHGTNSQQNLPLWERSSGADRGHRSSVDGALNAHRDRVAMRRERTEARLNSAKELTNRFFPTNNFSATSKPMNIGFDPVRDNAVNYQTDINEQQPMVEDNLPMTSQMDEVYQDMSMNPVRDHAIDGLENEVGTQDADYEDLPKGSIVDYQV